MKNLSSLLERLSKILNKDLVIKESIMSVIKDKTGISILGENISIKEGVLEIVSSPIVKSEINLKEDIIKTELKEVYKIYVSRILYK